VGFSGVFKKYSSKYKKDKITMKYFIELWLRVYWKCLAIGQ
jgi:hypothetical protein